MRKDGLIKKHGKKFQLEEKLNGQKETSVLSAPPKLSKESSEVLKKWLALFTQHYHQELLELGALAYTIGLADLTADEIERGCRAALLKCEFFPKIVNIREVAEREREIERIRLSRR